MQMQFYSRLPMKSTELRIIDLQTGEEKQKVKKKKAFDDFQFVKRGDRSRDLDRELQQ